MSFVIYPQKGSIPNGHKVDMSAHAATSKQSWRGAKIP